MAMNAGLNIWGYRGPVVGRKKPGERRVVVVGESTAFGYGVHWQESFPAYLQTLLNEQYAIPGRPVTVVNLAYNDEGAHSYKFTLGDYEYLDYDAVIFYSGYNDLGLNLNVFRHQSPIFRTFGYMPILPLVLHEKALSIQYGGRLDDAYWGKKVIFKPNALQRATASVLDRMSRTFDSIERPVASEGDARDADEIKEGTECGVYWAQYCGAMYQSVKVALDRQKDVLITVQPRLTDNHMQQQERLAAFLLRRFGKTPKLHFVDLRDAVNLREPSHLTLDGMHLTADGNQVIADKLAKPVSEMLQ
jgi:lysophospholipase L1-like esterase